MYSVAGKQKSLKKKWTTTFNLEQDIFRSIYDHLQLQVVQYVIWINNPMLYYFHLKMIVEPHRRSIKHVLL